MPIGCNLSVEECELAWLLRGVNQGHKCLFQSLEVTLFHVSNGMYFANAVTKYDETIIELRYPDYVMRNFIDSQW